MQSAAMAPDLLAARREAVHRHQIEAANGVVTPAVYISRLALDIVRIGHYLMRLTGTTLAGARIKADRSASLERTTSR
jgi:hypothetical protein